MSRKRKPGVGDDPTDPVTPTESSDEAAADAAASGNGVATATPKKKSKGPRDATLTYMVCEMTPLGVPSRILGQDRTVGRGRKLLELLIRQHPLGQIPPALYRAVQVD